MKDGDKKKEALNDIISNSDFSQSVFLNNIKEILSEMEPELVDEEIEYEETGIEEIVPADSLETIVEAAE